MLNDANNLNGAIEESIGGVMEAENMVKLETSCAKVIRRVNGVFLPLHGALNDAH